MQKLHNVRKDGHVWSVCNSLKVFDDVVLVYLKITALYSIGNYTNLKMAWQATTQVKRPNGRFQQTWEGIKKSFEENKNGME